jgi:hypothetical protein
MFKHKFVLPITIVLLLLAWSVVSAAGLPRIDSPRSGDVLQGSVEINGNTDLPDFESSEVSFSYDRADANTWFLISQSRQPVANGALATWDTTTITDGQYKLRLVVTFKNGQSNQTEVNGLQVANYTAVLKPQQTAPAETLAATQSVVIPTDHPTATALPRNPAEVTRQDLLSSLTGGALLALAIFLALGVYLAMRTFRRH